MQVSTMAAREVVSWAPTDWEERTSVMAAPKPRVAQREEAPSRLPVPLFREAGVETATEARVARMAAAMAAMLLAAGAAQGTSVAAGPEQAAVAVALGQAMPSLLRQRHLRHLDLELLQGITAIQTITVLLARAGPQEHQQAQASPAKSSFTSMVHRQER